MATLPKLGLFGDQYERAPADVRWEVLAFPEVVSFKGVDRGAEERREFHDALVEAGLHVDGLLTSTTTTRGTIGGWSDSSRVRMLKTIGSLEFEGRFGMLTLTLDGNWWQDSNGRWRTPDVVYGYLRAFRERWDRKYPECVSRGVWKFEVQRRGAPHYHLSLNLPEPTVSRTARSTGTAALDDRKVAGWCRKHWHEIVCHGGNECKTPKGCWHAQHGALLDTKFADNVRDGRSTIAAYFAKHGVWKTKDYQNDAPSLVLARARALATVLAPCGRLTVDVDEPGRLVGIAPTEVLGEWLKFETAWETPGRWWGVWRMAPVEKHREDDLDFDTVRVARLLARKLIARRSRRTFPVMREDGRLTAVHVRRTMRCLHGRSDVGFWMTSKDAPGLWWFLVRWGSKLRHLHGVELARALASIEFPPSEPPRPTRVRVLVASPG